MKSSSEPGPDIMDPKRQEDEKVDVNFESHPPIPEDLNGISTLLRQTLLQFVDCHSLAQYLIDRKDVTQVIAQEATEEGSSSDEDEPDDDIYGVSSVIDLNISEPSSSGDKSFTECRKKLLKFLQDKCPEIKTRAEQAADKLKLGLIINERYINLPPQLSLPIFKTLTKSIEEERYTHLVFVCKILLRSKNTDTRLPSKRSKSGNSSRQDAEPLVFLNPEEEIICEQSEFHNDFDVSAHCDENASWSISSDMKYIPHRRILVVDSKNWQKILKCLGDELN